MVQLGCTWPIVSQAPTAPSPTPVSQSTPLPTSSPATPTSLPTEDPAAIELERYGVSLITTAEISVTQRDAVIAAATALASRTAGVHLPEDPRTEDQYLAFRELFGPTIIRIYPDRDTVDGIHAGLNCGWEGRFAKGCKLTEIYPEQEFPAASWLILIAGGYTQYQASDGGVGLYAHEIVHNLTWGGGHLDTNIGGSSYVRYVGDVFAIRYMDYLGVQVGRDTYSDENARSSNPLWRAELTADAVSSWALDRISGPYASIINHYIEGMMTCEASGRTRC